MSAESCDLSGAHCKPCGGGVSPLQHDEIKGFLEHLNGWELAGNNIEKIFRFKNYYETIAFVNAIAWLSHREDHHPLLEVGFNQCRVRYTTHAIGGLSENDFICAAKVDALRFIPEA